MPKTTWKPGTMIYPVPAVMVTCGNNPDNYNIITIAWTGTINSDPPMCYISVRKTRNSYKLIRDCGEFVINLTTKKLAKATDWCGVRSGARYDKFKEMNLTPIPATYVKAPLIEESPINIECKVAEIKELGSHDMFLAEVLAVHADDKYLDEKTGAFDLSKANPITYMHGHYYTLGKPLGKFGWSVEKTKTKKKRQGGSKK
ncbi:MAG: flavin reductase family protein [Salinivirgaceae bacterium]|jgi:flavin reductase (DIM6/NTAB) family NADH-FMN oxidoreductase RutF|nr:flavin reductase family protein [Salinivirgaceae bacterium]